MDSIYMKIYYLKIQKDMHEVVPIFYQGYYI